MVSLTQIPHPAHVVVSVVITPPELKVKTLPAEGDLIRVVATAKVPVRIEVDPYGPIGVFRVGDTHEARVNGSQVPSPATFFVYATDEVGNSTFAELVVPTQRTLTKARRTFARTVPSLRTSTSTAFAHRATASTQGDPRVL